jgi:hypothetical protein
MQARIVAAPPLVLALEEWRPRESAHQARVDAMLAGHLDRAGRGEKHPVEDFLFTYYSLRPARLRRWHPGAGVALSGDGARERSAWREHVLLGVRNREGEVAAAVTLDVRAFLARRGETVRQVRRLLAATASRPAQLGCFGLHEWAMVYRQDPGAVRHADRRLRLGSAGTDAVVDRHRLRCTHHDAYRFFTVPARPLNTVRPRREDAAALEQPGCLHATMDLYKWAYKLLPAVPSELVADAFVLARDVRELDMRASPYDLSDLGYAPVPVETPEGKAAYVAAQRAFAERGTELRSRLLAALDWLEAPSTT